MKLTLIIIALCLGSCAWDKTDERNLIIYNRSAKSIYTVLGTDDTMKHSYLYSEYENKVEYKKREKEDLLLKFYEILPSEKDESSDRPKRWNFYFESSQDKEIRLFIIHKDTVDKYGWFEVFQRNIYNKKYKLTIQDLDKQKWEIVYE
jgi:hypothetical protein